MCDELVVFFLMEGDVNFVFIVDDYGAFFSVMEVFDTVLVEDFEGF